MKYLLYLSALVALLSCSQEIDSASSAVVGHYKVTMYAEDKDTLYLPGTVNKNNYKEFYLDVVKASNDTLIVYFMIRKDELCGYGYRIIANKTGDKYHLYSPYNSIDKDAGYFDGKIMYLKTAGWNDPERRDVNYTTVATKLL